jgi:hypothetical protein
VDGFGLQELAVGCAEAGIAEEGGGRAQPTGRVAANAR